MGDWFIRVYTDFFGSDVAVAPEYLIVFIITAFGVWIWQGRKGGFWRWLFPKDIWRHKSHRIDIWLFILGRVMVAAGLFGRISATTLVAGATAGMLKQMQLTQPDASTSPWIVALCMWLAYDFASYWMHRAYHGYGYIWPLHAVHHSAEVLTPFSAYRQHPLAVVLSSTVVSVFAGVVQGMVIAWLQPDMTLALLAGINAFFVLAVLAMGNFHHSHIWISYGPVLERLLISPAQHQIHHSTSPRHHNKNFGQTLALWDWMFGSLYLIRNREELVLGLDDPADEPLMTQRIGPILWDPIRRLWRKPRAKSHNS